MVGIDAFDSTTSVFDNRHPQLAEVITHTPTDHSSTVPPCDQALKPSTAHRLHQHTTSERRSCSHSRQRMICRQCEVAEQRLARAANRAGRRQSWQSGKCPVYAGAGGPGASRLWDQTVVVFCPSGHWHESRSQLIYMYTNAFWYSLSSYTVYKSPRLLDCYHNHYTCFPLNSLCNLVCTTLPLDSRLPCVI